MSEATETSQDAAPAQPQFKPQEIQAAFAEKTLSWEHFRTLQRIALSSDGSRKIFEEQTATVEKDPLRHGACLYILGRMKEAAKDLEKAHPASDIASALLGRLHEDAEDLNGAREIYAASLKKHPSSKDAMLGLIKVHLMLREEDEARKIFNKAEKAFEGDAELVFMKAFARELSGEYHEARELYEEVLSVNPEHAQALFRLGRYHMTWGDEDKAVECYEACARQIPTYGNALVNLGLLYEDRNQFDDAIRCYETVLKAIPDHPRASMFLKDAKASKSMYYDEERERRQDRQNQVLKIPVTDFELSVRSRNCLNKMNIRTLGDLINMTESELLAHKNFGETSLLEVKQMLAQKGLRLGQTRGAGGFESRIGVAEPLAREDVLKKPIADLELSVRSRNCMNRLGIKDIGELIQRTEQELLSAKNFGETSLNEIKTKLAELGLSLHRAGR